MNKFKLLFIGYNKKETKLIDFLKKKNILVTHKNKKLSLQDVNGVDLLISFGYKYLLKKELLEKLKRPAINLHMSFLPYNRGAHPNFWSFINETPKGISIHEIDEGVDTGNIITQKKYAINPSLNKFLSFKKTYDYLFSELELLFIRNYKNIIFNKYKKKKQKKVFQSNKTKDLPKNIKTWDLNILNFKKTNLKN
tara:strand:- start:404 stop:988 length:585 start_codon:yes stop_codon:yes gene_type:complete